MATVNAEGDKVHPEKVEHASTTQVAHSFHTSAASGSSLGIVTLTDASHSLANSAPRSGRHARTLPNLERCCSKLLVYGPFEEMALVVEGVVGRGVDVQEALR